MLDVQCAGVRGRAMPLLLLFRRDEVASAAASMAAVFTAAGKDAAKTAEEQSESTANLPSVITHAGPPS